MGRRAGLGARLRYEFDKSMAAGPVALVGWLSLITLAVALVAAIVLVVAQITPGSGERLEFGEAVWETAMRAMDAGTVSGDTGWAFRMVMLLVTVAGILVFSALIGVLSAGIDEKLDDLRKGRSVVLEEGHTVIFNWSSSIFDVIAELAIANQSVRRPRIVVLADKDKVEMEEAIAAKAGRLGRTRVICRSGDPTDLSDLAIASPQASKSIVVLSPDGDDPDASVIKTVLALVNDPHRREAPYRIAAEIRDPRNLEVARAVGGAETQLIMADDLIARIVVHASRQSGLSEVYSELLGFEGCEIYEAARPELAGRTFGEASTGFAASTLIGLAQPDGRVLLNPPPDTVIGPDDRGVFIAEDDTAIGGLGAPEVQEDAILPVTAIERRPEKTLILGWNRRGPTIVRELSRFVAPGSLLTIAANSPGFEAAVAGLVADGDLTIRHAVADVSRAAELEGLGAGGYDHIIVLSYSDHLGAQAADTLTLVTLLQIRRIADRVARRISVVSEMVDVRNRELATVTRADDFVVSNKLVSLMLAQASENEHLSAIFEDLLDEQGSEISMRPVEEYVAVGRPVSIWTLAEAARRRGEVALGYCRAGEGVVLNPEKSRVLTFEPGHRLVVLARD